MQKKSYELLTRVHAGTIDKDEMTAWRQQMKRDGFTALWTWICWLIRQHVKEKKGAPYV